jgi:WD40 repeat protein
MIHYEQRLLDPSQTALLAAVVKATKVANGRLRERRIDKDADAWSRFLARHRRKPEGKQQWLGSRSHVNSALVKLAWWSDHIGRKHWRVIGTRSTWSDFQTSKTPLREQPLWHLYPERLMVRERNATTEVIGLCQCGMIGPIRSLAWTGPCCGPCHDRQEEGTPVPIVEPRRMLKRHSQPVIHLRFLSAKMLLSAGSDGRLILWDLERDTHEVLFQRSTKHFYAVAVSCEGIVVASTAMSKAFVITNDENRTVIALSPRFSYVSRIEFSPDGQWFFINGSNGNWLFSVNDLENPQRLDSTGYGHSMGFFPDSRALLVWSFQRGLLRLAIETKAETILRAATGNDVDYGDGDLLEYFFHDDQALSAFSPNGEWLALQANWGGIHGIYLCHLPSKQWHGPCVPTYPIGQLVLSDTHLVVGSRSGLVQRFDLKTQMLLDTLIFHEDYNPRSLAISPGVELMAYLPQANEICVWPLLDTINS